ncbi:hypothetical protein ILYODFUR_024706 [Ilyodon furcidens]|uniref:CIDE-N domain-containing protein n=1 Tax=Ilyodon furcidens TaxID=33524 RepID=A0ABV0V5U0_9TELE
MTDGRPCKVCNFTRQKSYGVVVPSLDELKKKGCEFLGVNQTDPVSVVLEGDGTIVEDQAYFLCLPFNTKFMLLHDKETWVPARKSKQKHLSQAWMDSCYSAKKCAFLCFVVLFTLTAVDGGTAWMARESVLLEADAVDSSILAAPWWNLALQLKQDLASIILMSEGDLQSLVDAPCSELASALGFQEKKTVELQETLQRVLDRREEERQSKELLQLYLKAVEKEDRQQEDASTPSQQGAGGVDLPDGMEVDSASGFTSRTLMVLKGKTSPETRLSTEDLQVVVSRGLEAMQQVLGWDIARTTTLLQACEAELSTRLKQIRAMQSISSTQQDGSRQEESAAMATHGSS